MNTKENKEYRRLILEVNTCKNMKSLWTADKRIRAFIDRLSDPEEARMIANKLYNVSMTRHNNLIKYKNYENR